MTDSIFCRLCNKMDSNPETEIIVERDCRALRDMVYHKKCYIDNIDKQIRELEKKKREVG